MRFADERTLRRGLARAEKEVKDTVAWQNTKKVTDESPTLRQAKELASTVLDGADLWHVLSVEELLAGVRWESGEDGGYLSVVEIINKEGSYVVGLCCERVNTETGKFYQEVIDEDEFFDKLEYLDCVHNRMWQRSKKQTKNSAREIAVGKNTCQSKLGPRR